MNPPPANKTKRIIELDGLRGLAIILVVLNHLPLTPLFSVFPKFLHPFLSSVLNSGKVGVGILFLLSGFLIAKIYPQVHSSASFWQKRYTRIFPSFIAMCIALSIIDYFGKSFTPMTSIAVVLAVSTAGGVLWKLIAHTKNRMAAGKFLFFSFVIVQVLAIAGYLFVLNRVPPSVFYIVWPKWAHTVVYFIMNSTIALPFGTYVPLIDGAYWSVIIEVVFYLLYPIFILPVMKLVSEKRSKAFGVLCLALCLPFFYGLSVLFKSILGFQIMQIYLAIYFVFGVALGFVYTSKWAAAIQQYVNRLPAALIIVLGFVLATGLPYIRDIVHWGENVDIVYWVVPLSLLLIITLSQENSWTRMLRNPVLRSIGRVSYAIYLTHMFAIGLFFPPTAASTVLSMGIGVALTSAVIAITSTVLYYCLEAPYFSHKIPAIPKEKTESKVKYVSPGFRPLWVGIGVFLFFIWFAYRIPVTLTADVVNHTDATLPPVSPITTKPVTIRFTGAQPNLGMIFLNLKVLTGEDLKKFHITNGGDTFQYMVADIKDQNGKMVASNKYTLYQIYDSSFFTIGLPVQPNSLGKNFIVNLYASSFNAFQILGLVNSGATARSVYFYDKADLIRHPMKGLTLLWNKAVQPFTETSAREVALLCGPLIITIAVGLTLKAFRGAFAPTVS